MLRDFVSSISIGTMSGRRSSVKHGGRRIERVALLHVELCPYWLINCQLKLDLCGMCGNLHLVIERRDKGKEERRRRVVTWEWERVVSGGGQAERARDRVCHRVGWHITKSAQKASLFVIESFHNIISSSASSSNSLTVTVQFPAIRTLYMWTRLHWTPLL